MASIEQAEPVVSSIDELPTPALVIDGATVQRNIERMAAYASANGLNLRPHVKTHKSLELARLQLEAGASGLTVAKVGEAELMAGVCEDLLVAYPAVDPARCERLARLAAMRTVRVAVDTAAAVDALASAATRAGTVIGLLVDIDVGVGRTGVATAEDSLALAEFIDRKAGVRLDGILCYPGHILAPPDQQAPLQLAVAAKLQEALDLWAKHGLAARIVSGGTTPSYSHSHLVSFYTEIRPGTYIFNDMNVLRGGFCTLDDCAATIVATVVSDAVKNQVVLDSGTKTLTSDLCGPARDSGYGYLVEYPQAKIRLLTEEHAQVDMSAYDQRPAVGERVTIIPNHICPCVNLEDRIWWRETDGSLRPIRVDARGKLS